MALEGSLRDFDLFSLFNMIKTQGKSGTLVLSRGQEFVKIFFDQGEIVGCDSNQVRMEDRVGAMLVRLGRLSGEELLAMVQRQRQTLKRLGTLLLESGRVAPEDLQDALFNQAMSIIYRTFRWVEGDYRFDSILPLDLDRENFPSIPVDTILMEAARIMDEWPEVQRRLPDPKLPLVKTEAGRELVLDIDRNLASVFEGEAPLAAKESGLSHEQETTLTYFSEPSTIQTVLQISRYDELETSKMIADLIERGLLEVSSCLPEARVPVWHLPRERDPEDPSRFAPSALLWPAAALLLALPLALAPSWVPPAFTPGLACFRPADLHTAPDPATRDRQVWAFRLASPADGGMALAASLGFSLEPGSRAVPDLTLRPDPLAAASR